MSFFSQAYSRVNSTLSPLVKRAAESKAGVYAARQASGMRNAASNEFSVAKRAYTAAGGGAAGVVGVGAGLWTRPGFRYGTYGAGAAAAGLGVMGLASRRRRRD